MGEISLNEFFQGACCTHLIFILVKKLAFNTMNVDVYINGVSRSWLCNEQGFIFRCHDWWYHSLLNVALCAPDYVNLTLMKYFNYFDKINTTLTSFNSWGQHIVYPISTFVVEPLFNDVLLLIDVHQNKSGRSWAFVVVLISNALLFGVPAIRIKLIIRVYFISQYNNSSIVDHPIGKLLFSKFQVNLLAVIHYACGADFK